MKKKSKGIEINNKRVFHDYYVIETLECGIELKGNEVKSLRKGEASLKEAYVQCTDKLVLINAFIHKWETANDYDVAERRPRTLLAHKQEIKKLGAEVKEKGMTIMPLKIYFNEQSKCKVLIGLCKGKHVYDKRKTEKEKEIKRELERYV